MIIADLTQVVTGIHETGPNLTPDTFKDAVFNAPVAGGTPLAPLNSRGNHGLWPGTDWGGTDDTGLIWWNPEGAR